MVTPNDFVDRDPDAPVRTRRALDKLSTIVNSLIRDGTLVLTGPGQYAIDPGALRIPAGAPPGSFGDEPVDPPFAFVPGPKGDTGATGATGASGSSSTAVPLYAPDAPPESADAADDEFGDGSLGAAWTDWDAGSVMAYSEGDYGAKLVHTGTAGDSISGISRAIPVGDFAIVTKVSVSGLGTNFTQAGIFVSADVVTNPSTAALRFWGVLEQNTNQKHLRALAYSNYTTFSSELIDNDIRGFSAVYMRIRRVSTTLYYDYSGDGLNWIQAASEAEPYTLVRCGICTNGAGHSGSVPTTAYFRFFRKQSGTGLDNPLLGRFTASQGADGPIGPPGVKGEDGEDGTPGPPGNAGPVGATGATGGTGADGEIGFSLQEEPGEGQFGPPGDRGPRGFQGESVFVLPEEPQEPQFVPGDRGPTGLSGSQGQIGFSLQEEPIEGQFGPPGDRGATGATGQTGSAGQTIFVLPEDPEMPPFVPGANGATGQTGSAGQTIFVVPDQFDQDFTPAPYSGATPFLRLRGYKDGFQTSRASTTTVTVAAGVCRNSTNTAFIELSASTTKTLQNSGSFATGTGQNGLDTGARGNSTWYHVFVIASGDGTAAVDVLFSTSFDAPTMPTGFVLFRRVGSVRTDGSGNILNYVQNGNQFSWVDVIADVVATNPGTAAVTRTLTVPPGLKVFAVLGISFAASASTDNPAGVYISDLATTDTAPSAGINSVILYTATALVSTNAGLLGFVRTNTSSQVRSRLQISSTNTVVGIYTYGWIDPMGVDQ